MGITAHVLKAASYIRRATVIKWRENWGRYNMVESYLNDQMQMISSVHFITFKFCTLEYKYIEHIMAITHIVILKNGKIKKKMPYIMSS